MLDQEIVELINNEIEGVINDRDKKILQEYLNTNQEADQYYNDLKKISGLLAEVKEVNPSPNLKTRIQNLIDSNLYTKAQKNSLINWFTTFKAGNLKPLLALSFVSCLLIRIFLYAGLYLNVFQSNKIDTQEP